MCVQAIAEMNLPMIVAYLHMKLDRLLPAKPLFCPVTHALDKHKQGSALLVACGQNTEELDRAIAATEKEFANLKTARESACVR